MTRRGRKLPPAGAYYYIRADQVDVLRRQVSALIGRVEEHLKYNPECGAGEIPSWDSPHTISCDECKVHLYLEEALKNARAALQDCASW